MNNRKETPHTDSIYKPFRHINNNHAPVKVAIEKCTGNEYFVKYEDSETYRVVHFSGISCNVYKRGFSIKFVSESYTLPKLK